MTVVQSPATQTGSPNPLRSTLLFKEAKQRERRRRLLVVGALLAACLVVTVAVVAAAGGFSTAGDGTRSSASKPIEVASNALTHAYQPPPTDGWKPGDSHTLAGFFGRFHATLTSSGACASMGIHPGVVYLWPAGYRVRFDPTELLSPSGKVIAHQGQEVNAGGGGYSRQAAGVAHPVARHSRLLRLGQQRHISIESPVVEGQGPQ